MSKDRRLGRGLAALLGDDGDVGEGVGQFAPTIRLHGSPLEEAAGSDTAERGGPEAPQPPASSTVAPFDPARGPQDGDLIMLTIQEIEGNPFQPRRDFSESEIASLAESLKSHDMLQPVLVRRVGDRWQLISGERRLRAAVYAGWTQIPARVRKADDRLVAELAIVENLQRKDLNPIEKALSFRRYLDQHQCTQDELGRRLKIDRSTIANLMRLLELPQVVQDELASGAVSAGHARALLPLGDEAAQIQFSQRIQREGLSVRETERLVAEQIRREDADPLSAPPPKGSSRTRRTRSPHIASLEQQLRIALGTRVDIRQSARSRGQLVIHFRGSDEFERLTQMILDQTPESGTNRFAG